MFKKFILYSFKNNYYFIVNNIISKLIKKISIKFYEIISFLKNIIKYPKLILKAAVRLIN
jgi:hypothetical protein